MNKLIKSDKGQMIVAMIFFVLIMPFGLIAYYTSVDSLMESSLLFRVFSIIAGISLFLTVFTYIYIAVRNSVLFSGITRYLRVIEVIAMILLFQYGLREESGMNIELSLIILSIVASSIVIIDVVIYFVHRKRSDLIIHNEEKQFKLKSYQEITSKVEGESLFVLCMGLFFFLFVIDKEVGSVYSYVLLMAVNVFFIYKYVSRMKKTKEEIKKLSLITGLLAVLSITLLEVFSRFFSSIEILYIFMMMLPTLYLYPSIFKNYYYVYWKSMLE